MHLSPRFDNVGERVAGSDVRLAGVKVGSVTGLTIDPQTFQAILDFTVRPDLKLPTDSSAVISTGGLLGVAVRDAEPRRRRKHLLQDGGTITVTQSATNLEDLLGKFIFNVGSLADATQKSLQQHDAPTPAMTALPARWPQPDGSPISCREKLRTLEENHAEAAQVLQDAFEDAVLMGVDEQAMRDDPGRAGGRAAQPEGAPG